MYVCMYVWNQILLLKILFKKIAILQIFFSKNYFFFYLFVDMPNEDWYSYSTFDFLLNYVFQNYLRVIFDLKSRIWKNSNFLEK